jgi:hypothetical protein
MFSENLYYAEDEVLQSIGEYFELVESWSWYELYKHKGDGSFWRLDKWDKYQTQYFVRISDLDSWHTFDITPSAIQLLKDFRGVKDSQCNWKDCANRALNNLAFCEFHAYNEMGIRK